MSLPWWLVEVVDHSATFSLATVDPESLDAATPTTGRFGRQTVEDALALAETNGFGDEVVVRVVETDTRPATLLVVQKAPGSRSAIVAAPREEAGGS